jgi:hypothetical protein
MPFQVTHVLTDRGSCFIADGSERACWMLGVIERVMRERLSAAPARANPSHDPPFDSCILPKALQVIGRAKDVSHPDKW